MDQSGIIATVDGHSKGWINELPHCILSHVVSLLKIKDGVETSLVSRQWRYLWKPRSNLEFDIPNILGGRYARLIESYTKTGLLILLSDKFDKQCFVRRVNKVLELYSGNKVDSLRVAFFFDVYSTEILDKWIRFAIAKGVQVVDLQLFRSETFDHALFYVFPHWILSELDTASALKHLSLHRCVLRPPSDFNRLAQLTRLRLEEVIVDPGLENLFSICVLLEGLTLIKCSVESNLTSGPSLHLKDLILIRCCYLRKIKIKIYAANLSSFEFDGNISAISCMRTPQLVRFFYMGDSSLYGLPYAFTLIALCPVLETLHLQLSSDVENIPQTVLIFGNLKQMHLDIFTPDFDIWSVLNIFEGRPL